MFMHNFTNREFSTTLNDAAVRSGTSALTLLADGRFSLALSGKFQPRWLANLTSNLAANDINILHGKAEKVTPVLWEGVFELEPTTTTALSRHDDFVAMTVNEKHTPKSPAVRLDDFALQHCKGGLRADISGPDSLGFLVALFNRFTFFSLFPTRVQIDTPGGTIRDSFWLRGIGGTVPSEECRLALNDELAKLVAG